MKKAITRYLYTISLSFLGLTGAYSQEKSVLRNDLTISYAIHVNSGKKSVTAADAYDGGSKTVFVSGKKTRIRLVSLMRMESIYFGGNSGGNVFARRVKESGKNPNNISYSRKEWQSANKKYDSAICVFQDDSLQILGYLCYKCVITTRAGEEIVAYFTPQLPNLANDYDPAFNCLPGLVLQYEYSYKSTTVMCRAVTLSKKPVKAGIFSPPTASSRRLARR